MGAKLKVLKELREKLLRAQLTEQEQKELTDIITNAENAIKTLKTILGP